MFQLSHLLSFAIFALFIPTTKAQTPSCIRNLTELDALQQARGRRVGKHVTYILCPNTVYLPTDEILFKLNGNATYLCGSDGSSANNCIVRGGYTQVSITLFPYNWAKKDNITVSGFIFEKSPSYNLIVASDGRFTFRDCIFRDNVNYAVASLLFGSDPTSRRVRHLKSLSEDYDNSFDEIARIRSNEEKVEEGTRSLVTIDGNPRTNIVFDKCEFRNNTLIMDEDSKFFGYNGVFNAISRQADVTLTNCLFKDNRYDFRRDGPGYGYLVFIEAGSTLNIQNSCFIDNYVEFGAPVWVRCASGRIDSGDNYIDDIERGTDCQYMFNQEQYKCFAPESPYCPLASCAASYKVFNARTDRFFANIANGGTINNPPCSINIEAILPCASKGVTATIQLLQGTTVIQELADKSRFFLFGNNKENIFSGTIASGTYTIQTKVNGIVQPAPFSFTLAGTCVR